jgi:myo-inositol-1(or 4)-monophosphatase
VEIKIKECAMSQPSNGVHSSICNPERLLEQATQAAQASGEILLSFMGKLQQSQIQEADLASERHLVEILRRVTPEFAIEAEEEVRDAQVSADQPRWFLDPLDGTTNFIHSLPMFAVSMGLYVGLEPQLAVVHLPRLGETFTALRGAGAWLNGEPIHVSKTKTLGESVLATGFPYRRNELEHSNLENFGRFFYDQGGVRRMGSAAIDLCYVGAGRLDGYWELHLSPHDVAGGALIVREAGGLVTDADGAEDWLRGGHIVAAGPSLHPQICTRVEH